MNREDPLGQKLKIPGGEATFYRCSLYTLFPTCTSESYNKIEHDGPQSATRARSA